MIDGARVMMWANYRRGPSISVPAPFDDNSSPYWWYDVIASNAHEWAAAGITDVLFPQPAKTASGAYRGGDGYGQYSEYDLGTQNTTQFGGIPTRFGTGEQLRRAIAVCHANGMNVLLDHVMHQRMGGKDGVYQYPGADGKTLNGRFPKHPGCFMGDPPRVPRDPIPDVPDDFSFGDELCPVNAVPKGYVWDGLLKAGDWLVRTTGVQGLRLDDMKATNIEFIKAFMTHGAMKGLWFFGEYASGNRNDTDWWVAQVDGLASAFDFDFHYNMAQPMCNEAGSGKFYMGSLAGRGMIATNPMKAVPFVESMDSDTDGFATIVFNKMLAEALMLGGEGMPCIYARDYLTGEQCYGLGPKINNLIWIHQMLANGFTVPRHGDGTVFVFERVGPPGLLVALNNDVFNPDWKFITVQTDFGGNVRLHDYSGHAENDVWTDWNGVAQIAVPPGANGLGYSCWSRAGQDGPIKVVGRGTTQTFFGAEDLDTGPAQPSRLSTAGRIWCAAESTIELRFHAHETNWPVTATVTVTLVSPGGYGVAEHIYGAPGDAAVISAVAQQEGFYQINVGATLVTTAYEIEARYTAPQRFTLGAAGN